MNTAPAPADIGRCYVVIIAQWHWYGDTSTGSVCQQWYSGDEQMVITVQDRKCFQRCRCKNSLNAVLSTGANDLG